MSETADLASESRDWEQLFLLGNLQFDQGAFGPAALSYERARQRLLQRSRPWEDAADAVSAMVVTYLNLAEAQARNQAIDAACRTLCTVHETLLQARSDDALEASHQEAVILHLRETFNALLRFRDRYGDRPELHRLICPDCGDHATPPSPRQALH